MTTYEKVKAVADALGIPAYPDDFTRPDTKYITYNFLYEDPADFGDDQPHSVIGSVQVHLFMPRDENFFALRTAIRQGLFEQGLTYPTITLNTIETGTTTRHIVFECEDDEDAENI